MTLDEAIKHCEEVATQCTNTNKKCSNDHIQLANWLKELKKYKKKWEMH